MIRTIIANRDIRKHQLSATPNYGINRSESLDMVGRRTPYPPPPQRTNYTTPMRSISLSHPRSKPQTIVRS
jgi:hypothetical protein